MKFIFLVSLLLSLVSGSFVRADDKPTYLDPQALVVDRVNDLLGRMTLEEKIDMLGGTAGFRTTPNARLHIPSLVMADGRMGILEEDTGKGVDAARGTAYPAGIALSASFDRDLAARFGESIGRDARARGINVWLAPMMNIYRTPVGGRNFECGGEDPFLISALAVPEVNAFQKQDVMATAAIFCCNDQDFGQKPGLDRNSADSTVDERTLNEIYFPPFRALAEQAHVGAFMASYNLLNGEHCASSQHLLTDTLKTGWGFQGFIMSDWGAANDGIAAANAGLDLDMPAGAKMNKAVLLPAIKVGTVKPAIIDDKIRRILTQFFSHGFFDRPQQDKSIPMDDPRSAAVALDMAREEMVLLKNQDHLLPLQRGKIHTVAVLGPNADPAVWSASGSSFMANPFHVTSVLEGIRQQAGSSVKVVAVPWQQYPPTQPKPGLPFLYQQPGEVRPVADLIADSVKAAKAADVAVVCVGFRPQRMVRPELKDLSADEGEGLDRPYQLPPDHVALIKAVTAANPRTIVIFNAGGGVDWSGWLDQTPALIDAWYPGEAGGQALGEILFGDTNPSGKLPATFGKKWEDVPSSKYYDGVVGHKVIYGEGIFTGYRGYDENKIEPEFPFGFGLSYTTFDYANLHVVPTGDSQNPKVTVSFDLKNTGSVAGAEIAQVYMADPHASVPRPPRELKGFARVQLAPGETKTVNVDLDRAAFCFYDGDSKSWKFEPGKFVIQVGPSSRTLPLEQDINL